MFFNLNKNSYEKKYFSRKLSNVVAYLLILAVTLFAGKGAVESMSEGSFEAPVIVIDAGHGGLDGGAVSSDGVSEKDINLKISRMIKTLAESDGIRVVMTRDSEGGLYTGVENDGTQFAKIIGKRSIRSLKIEDLHKRREIIDQTEPQAMLSIHLNSFKQDRSVHGAQVFFASSGEKNTVNESMTLATLIQNHLISGINDGNTRQPLGKNDVTILKNAIVPSVIVECGFLSNITDLKNLQTEEYCQKVAQSIYEGVRNFLGWEPKAELEIITT